MSQSLPQVTLDFVREAKATGVRVSVLPRILEVVGSAMVLDDVDGFTLLGLRHVGLSRSSRAVKRSFDFVGALAGLVVLSPVSSLDPLGHGLADPYVQVGTAGRAHVPLPGYPRERRKQTLPGRGAHVVLSVQPPRRRAAVDGVEGSGAGASRSLDGVPPRPLPATGRAVGLDVGNQQRSWAPATAS